MKFLKSKEFLIGVGSFTAVGLIIWAATAIEQGFADFWWVILITLPLSLIISVPIAYAIYKNNTLFSKPIAYTLWKDHSTKTIGFTIWGPDAKRHYTIFKIVYTDGTSTEQKVVSQSKEYEKLMKYWKSTEPTE